MKNALRLKLTDEKRTETFCIAKVHFSYRVELKNLKDRLNNTHQIILGKWKLHSKPQKEKPRTRSTSAINLQHDVLKGLRKPKQGQAREKDAQIRPIKLVSCRQPSDGQKQREQADKRSAPDQNSFKI